MDSPPKPSLPLEGWGEDPKKIEAIIKDNAEVLAMYREEMLQQSGARNDLHNNIMEVMPSQGTSRAYSIARVKKDCDPETVAEVLAMYREEMVEKPGRPAGLIHDNVMNKPQGNARAYSIARVKKDCDPETVAEVLAMYREEMLQGSGARNDLGNNVTEVERVTGTSRAYSIGSAAIDIARSRNEPPKTSRADRDSCKRLA